MTFDLGGRTIKYRQLTSNSPVGIGDSTSTLGDALTSSAALLTNKSGVDRSTGDVVIIDFDNDESFETTTTEGVADKIIGVCAEDIAINDAGLVVISGKVEQVNLGGTIPTRGHFLITSTTAGQATTSSTRRAGAFAQAIEAAADGAAMLSGYSERSGGLDWFNVKDYGATGDASTDDTSAINTAIAALIAAGSGVLYFPKGTYKTTAALTTLSVPCVVRGDGANDFDGDSPISLVTCTSATANLFTVTADQAKFVDIGFKNTAATTPTAGSAISTQGAHIEQRVDYDSITVHGFYINVDVQVGGQWTMRSCFIGNPVQYGLKIRNTVNPDAGDWSISDCNFNADDYAAAAAIRVESSGGGKITNVKINMGFPVNQKFAYGIDYSIGSGADTILLLVSNCSIENITADAIRIVTTGSGRFGLVAIDGVQVGNYSNNTGYAVNLIAAATGGHAIAGGLGTIIIDGLIADTGGTPRAAVSLTNTDNVILGQMALSGFNARYIGSGDTNTLDASAPSSADYLVGTAHSALSGEIVVGTTPGGELGGTWASPTVDSVHSGSAHLALGTTSSTAAAGDHVHAEDVTHVHITDEQLSGDGTTTVFILANEAEPETAIAYVGGTRTSVTVGGTINDEITFASAPASGTDNISVDYVAVAT